MATAVQTMTPEDQAFVDAFRAQTGLNNFGTKFPNYKTYAEKLKYVRAIYIASKTPAQKQAAIDEGVKWLKANNPGILDQNGNPFKDGFYADVISGDAATQKRNAGTLDAIRTTSATDYVDNILDPSGSLGTAARAAEIAKITQGTKIDPYTPAKLATAVNSVRDTAAYKPGSKTFDQLKATYGGFLDSSGKPVFSDTTLKAVANAKSLGEVSNFNTKLNSLADSVLTSQGSSYVSLDPVKKAEAKQALFKDPTTFVTSVNGLNKTNKTNLGTPSTLTGGSGIDTLTPVKSLKTWKAPQQGVATANSPYSGLLDATLAKVTGANFGTPTNNAVYKNLTDPLTQGMGLDSLPKPKLIYDTADTAGITGLGDVKGTLQSLNTQVTSTPTYNPNQIANANTALENAAAIAGKVVDPGKVVNPPVVNPPVVNPPVVNPPVVNPPVVNPPVVTPVVNPPVVTPPVVTPVVTQANLEASAQNAGYQGDLSDTAAMQEYLNSQNVDVRDYTGLYAEQQAIDKAEADRQAGLVALANQQAAEKAAADKQAAETAEWEYNSNKARAETAAWEQRQKAEAERQTEANRLAALARNPDGGPSSLAPINPNTYGPQQVTLAPGTVNTTPAQNNLGPLNISNLGAVISPQAMNSNAGGVASLVGPQVTVQPAVTQQPAVNYTYAPSSQQQLEDRAVNAGYQGDYSDTAAMQGYLNSNAGGVASLVGPQVTVQPQPVVTQQPTSNIVAGVGTNPALRAKVLAAQAANMKQ